MWDWLEIAASLVGDVGLCFSCAALFLAVVQVSKNILRN